MRPEHKPLHAYRVISILCSIILFASFVLLLLVGISLPIVKAVYVIKAHAVTDGPATSIATELRFGVWGVCASSVLNPPSWFDNNGLCFGPKLGYDIPDSIASIAGLSDSVIRAIKTSLSAVLITHIVAAGLACLNLFTSLFLASHKMSILSLLLSIIAALLTSIMFVIDLVLVITARDRLPGLTNGGFVADFGNAIWMVLAAVVCNWIAVILLSARACYCCGVRKSKY